MVLRTTIGNLAIAFADGELHLQAIGEPGDPAVQEVLNGLQALNEELTKEGIRHTFLHRENIDGNNAVEYLMLRLDTAPKAPLEE